ncbi:DUF2933 domain-containing protein [Pseudomonas sp. G5(2012)]|uniref:DUF2933 domain-containing protein n=1 Tax=Pseudomonas sp. G5(2012) TaxID=1268068 RepID=UPI0009DB8011
MCSRADANYKALVLAGLTHTAPLQLATCLLVHLFMPHEHGDHQQRHEQQTHPAREEHQP